MEESEFSDEAFVTLATNDEYANGALVLGDSLRKVNTRKKLAILITKDVSQMQRTRLSQLWDNVIEVEQLHSNDKINLDLIERPELGVTFTKLKIWTLVQFKKCVFLDADTLVIQNIDDLFEKNELSAAPDIGWPDCFNSGVFVFVPSLQTYTALIQFANDHGSFDGGDQGLLNMYFKNWPTDLSYHLPFTYNMVSSTYYTYQSAYNHYGKDVKVVHYLGASKPWNQHYDYSKSQVSISPPSGHNDNQRYFTQIWWDRYNALPQTLAVEATVSQPQIDQSFDNQEYFDDYHQHDQNHDNHGYHDSSPEEPCAEDDHDDGQKAWERGEIDFTWRDRFSSIQYHLDNTIGETGGSKIFDEDHDYYEEKPAEDTTAVEHYHEQANAVNFSFQANYEKSSTEYISFEQSNENTSEVTEKEEYQHEIYVSSDLNGDRMESEIVEEESIVDPEKARMLRWENNQMDFRGEDRFEFIEHYLDSLISTLETAAQITEIDSAETPSQTEPQRNSSPTFSLSDSAYSELSPDHVERISRGTQTSGSFQVSKAVQTDFIEIS